MSSPLEPTTNEALRAADMERYGHIAAWHRPQFLLCPGCGGRVLPVESTLRTRDYLGRPATIVFFNCPDCDFSTWDKGEYRPASD